MERVLPVAPTQHVGTRTDAGMHVRPLLIATQNAMLSAKVKQAAGAGESG